MSCNVQETASRFSIDDIDAVSSNLIQYLKRTIVRLGVGWSTASENLSGREMVRPMVCIGTQCKMDCKKDIAAVNSL